MKPRARTEELLTEEVGDELVVYDRARQIAHRLNRTSRVVWQHCNGERSVSTLADVVARELDVQRSETLVHLALKQLQHAHLLRPGLSLSWDHDHLTRRGALKAAAYLLPVVATVVVPSPLAAQTFNPVFTPILPANAVPTISITSPTSNSSVAHGTTVVFTATAVDEEDGDLSSQITWNSSIDGDLGTGASITKVLSDGTHEITASVRDSGLVFGIAMVFVTVEGPVAGPTSDLQATPNRLDKTHNRGESPCFDPFAAVNLRFGDDRQGQFRIVTIQPPWLLAVPLITGDVPGVIQFSFTCDVGPGNLVLQHFVRIQGVNAATGVDEGAPAVVEVNVTVQ